MQMVVWSLFAALFAAFSIREALAARKSLDVEPYDLGFSDLNAAHRLAIEQIQETYRRSHVSSAWSYGLAALAAVGSLVLSVA